MKTGSGEPGWTKSFDEEQQRLRVKLESGEGRYVFLDPDGTWGTWMALVIRHPTGIVYGTQCNGTGCEQRLIEGYLVPVMGWKYGTDGAIQRSDFTGIFHEGKACIWKWKGCELPGDRLEKLRLLVEEIPCWQTALDSQDSQAPLHLDPSRIDEIAEAWIPVETPDGPGVLLFDNCD